MVGSKRKKEFNLPNFLAWLGVHINLIVMAIIILYPVLWLIGSAINPIRGTPGAVMADNFHTFIPIPRAPSLASFQRLFDDHNFGTWYRNSLIIAIINTVGTILVHTFMGYVFARLQFRGRKAGLLSIMVLNMFPSFLAMVAIYSIFLTFGWLDNIYALALLYIGGGIPGTMWLMRGYMLNIPKSLDEAAYIDGATKMQVFTKVIFPLSKPIITFIGFGAFMGPWMDFIFPRLLLRSTENHTIAIGLFELAGLGDPINMDITAYTAAALIIAVPFGIIFFIFQKYFALGIAAGANKGE
ncbi:MAG: sugar ABC transporter permease [Defluviitaleaceae bacterium]|nr:sugar ABC transporter permease [Defluviitaleaceae bacterium]MCL2274918.1 sugar ABC transporter permease [Defluviitaleaceae bacterium]